MARTIWGLSVVRGWVLSSSMGDHGKVSEAWTGRPVEAQFELSRGRRPGLELGARAEWRDSSVRCRWCSEALWVMAEAQVEGCC